MADVATLMVKIGGDDSGAREAMDRSNRAVKESGGFFRDALKNAFSFAAGLSIFNAGAGAVGSLRSTLGDMVKSGENANREMAILEAGLKSTHDASGQTLQSLDKLSTGIMNMTGIDDDAVKSAEQMLLTFTGIGKETFPQATQAVADMATRMNGGAIPSAQQMQQQALMLGKALNDPIKGITALTREGVTFTDQQKAQIAALEKSGNVAGAQKIILAELNKEFGGSAAAAGQANGGIAIFSAQLDNMKQSIGQAIVPALIQLMNGLHPIVNALTDALPAILPVVTGLLSGVFAVGKQVADVFVKNLKPALDSIFDGFTTAAKGIGGFDLSSITKTALRLADAISNGLNTAIKAAMPIIGQLADLLENGLIPMWQAEWNIIQQDVLPVFMQLVGIFSQNVLPAIASLQQWTDAHLMPALKRVADLVKTTVVPIVKTLAETFQHQIVPIVERVGSIITDKLMPPLENIAKKILPILNPLIQSLGWIFANIVGPAIGATVVMFAGLATGISDVINWIGNLFGWFGQVKDQIGQLMGHFNDLNNLLNGAVSDAINGIGTVFGNVFGGLWDVAKAPLNLLIGGINAIIDGLDSIHIKIPGWVPAVGGQTWGIDIPKIPTLATGGDVSGPFIGGEAGAELLVRPGLYSAPAGSHVFNAQQTAEILRAAQTNRGGGGNIYNITVEPKQAVVDTRELGRILQRRDRLAGIAS